MEAMQARHHAVLAERNSAVAKSETLTAAVTEKSREVDALRGRMVDIEQ